MEGRQKELKIRFLPGWAEVVEPTLPGRFYANPMNLYGKTKLEGERAVLKNHEAGCKHSQTYVKDVASVCLQLTERKFEDASIKGVYHWSGNEQMTKYEMACTMADAFNLPSSHLRPISEEPVEATPRPWNPQLDCSKLENIGIGQRTPFRAAISESLWPFLVDKRWRQTVFH
ncbi:hypothetical protein GDO86_005417 [Hymenochirus boettgeri]|uniref:Methionine adenosyltransferase 2 subunit beta n=1 Tax=Hymenochirus boettgeri TaxID=247094 RepID=A0A8T2J1R3_9PIPI|nr:hypothetical protein GDO86_005417 [Hymenochirus boettgeri]